MNDNDFDGYVKKSLEKVEGPEPTPDSFLDFQSRIKSFHQVSWFYRYRVPLTTVAILAFFTFVNGMFYFHKSSVSTVPVVKYLSNENYKREVDSLIIYTKALRNEVNASIRLISGLKKQNTENGTKIAQFESSGTIPVYSNHGFDLGDLTSIPPDVLKKLESNPQIETKNGHIFLMADDTIVTTKRVHYEVEYVISPQELQPGDTIITQTVVLKNPMVPRIKAVLPARMINKLEEHSYKGGIGLTLSPHLDLMHTSFSKGNGNMSPRVGIRADWILSPHWSIQTSLDYLTSNVSIRKDFQDYELPNLSTSLGNVQRVGITNFLVGLPIAVRYKWWISSAYQLQVSAGATPYFSFGIDYKYHYPFPGRPQDSDVNLTTITEVSRHKYNNSSATLSFGVIRTLKKNRFLEVSLYYEQGMLSASRDHLTANIMGLRTAMTFPVRGM